LHFLFLDKNDEKKGKVAAVCRAGNDSRSSSGPVGSTLDELRGDIDRLLFTSRNSPIPNLEVGHFAMKHRLSKQNWTRFQKLDFKDT
jgi:hypothetical protein